MDIVFDPTRRTEPVTPMFPPLTRTIEQRPGVIDLDRSVQVTSAIQRLEVLSLNPATRDEAQERLKALPVRYFANLQFDKAAQAATYLFKRGLTTPAELFDQIIRETSAKARLIRGLETQRGLSKPGRFTIGGLLDPGIRTSVLTQKSLLEHSLKESLETTLRDGNRFLVKMFPHLVPN